MITITILKFPLISCYGTKPKKILHPKNDSIVLEYLNLGEFQYHASIHNRRVLDSTSLPAY